MALPRRTLLTASTSLLAPPLLMQAALSRTIREEVPWSPGEAYPPQQARPGGWLFFTQAEAAMVEAIVDRLIPEDELGPGGRRAGCAVFMDRQLAGPYGRAEGVYMQGPFPPNPLPTQGFQSPLTPAQAYREGLRVLAAHVAQNFNNRRVEQLTPDELDRLLQGLERNQPRLEGAGATIFEMIYANTMEGFFADPIYGGNQDMAGWKLVGFPGTRYDYRDVIERPNQRYTMPPVALTGRPEWRGNGGRT